MIRLGRIGYVNMAPVFYRLEAEVEEVVGVPTDLNRQLIAGELDVAPISSIEYARSADRLRLLPRLCVSSEGAVESIQLISKTPPEQVRTIAVTPESATSVVLTKVLFPDAEHVPNSVLGTTPAPARINAPSGCSAAPLLNNPGALRSTTIKVSASGLPSQRTVNLWLPSSIVEGNCALI